jgi:hypothetical protein
MAETLNDHSEDMLSDPTCHCRGDYQGRDCTQEIDKPIFPAHALTGFSSFI